MYPPVDPIIFAFGPFALRWYGLLMLTAILLGAWIASEQLERQGEPGDNLWDMLIWLLVPAMLGARLYYVFIQSPRSDAGIGYYLSHPGQILQVWQGGIHIFGAFIAGSLALVLYCRWKKLAPLKYLDAIALALPLAQAVGRWGNFINQELYGPPTQLPWGLLIDARHRIAPYQDLTAYPDSTRFQPLFLYESLWNFLGFALIFWLSRRFDKQLQDGDILLMYLLWYPTGRFFIEFLRTDSWFFPGTPFNVVHILCAVAITISAATLWWRHGRKKTAET
ncbi:MAG: prolipoprotein diacylglyceryl transferase [Cyanobacteria bacterium P01_H01_bin.15]